MKGSGPISEINQIMSIADEAQNYETCDSLQSGWAQPFGLYIRWMSHFIKEKYLCEKNLI
jgi:hypothetical protein